MSLALDSVAVRYSERHALMPTTLALDAKRHVGLIGPNGAGKSSLLKSIAGLLPADGRITWSGSPVQSMRRGVRARTFAYLSQTPLAFWPMRVGELVALGRLPHRRFGEAISDADEAAVSNALQMTDTAELRDRPISELSGGELARVQLARALCVDAPVLLVDEPTALLDPYHQLKIMTVLRSYAERGALVISVLHDLTLAARFCDEIVLLSSGRAVAQGPAGEVISAAVIKEVYRVDPFVGSHHNEPLIVPWAIVKND